jgi:hypothetical protein
MEQGGDVFVLEMGQPVKIIDLARRMVELSGLTVRDELHPDGDIELTVTSLRPGEKLFEELLIGDSPKSTQHPRIMKAHEQYLRWPQLEGKLNALSIAMSVNDVPVIRAQLQELVSGYQPSGEVVDWVHMALNREVAFPQFSRQILLSKSEWEKCKCKEPNTQLSSKKKQFAKLSTGATLSLM